MKTRNFLKGMMFASITCLATLGSAQTDQSQNQNVGDLAFPRDQAAVPGMPTSLYNPNTIMGRDPLWLVQSFAKDTGAFVNCQTGNCSFETPTQLHMLIAGYLKDTTDFTRKKYEDLEGEVKRSLVKITTDLWSANGLVGLSMNSVGSNTFIRSEDLFKAYAQLQSAELSTNAKIETLGAFFETDFPGIPLSDKEKVITQKFPGGKTNVNVATLMNVYRGNIRAINAMVASMNFYVVFPTGEIRITDDGNSQTSYNANNDATIAHEKDPNGAHPFSCKTVNGVECAELAVHLAPAGIRILNDQHDALVKKIEDLRHAPPIMFGAVTQFHLVQRSQLLSFAKTFGKSQMMNRAYGWACPKFLCGAVANLADGRDESEEDAYKQIITHFYIRSLLRAIRGFGIGAFKINASVDWSTTDLIKPLTNIVASVDEAPLYTNPNFNASRDQSFDAIAQEQVNNYQAALNAASSKARLILGVDKVPKTIDGKESYNLIISKGETSGIFDFANSSYQAFKGQADYWKAQYLLLRLMAADMYEEKLVRSAGGMKKMQDYFRMRYKINASAKEQAMFKELVDNSILQYVLAGQNKVTATSDVQAQDDDSVKGAIMHLKNALDIWRTRVTQARILQIQVDAATNATTSEEGTAEVERSEILLDN